MSELKIDNLLEPLYNPDRRGICIYLANTLDLISTSSTKYHSQATIALEDNVKLTISCHYRSPSYNEDENNKFIEDMEYILAQDHSHHLMMGDFNMPHTDWTRMVSNETFEQSCINKLNDHFMYQHVTTATRFRINQNPNILYLVLTNEEHMIPDGVTTESPLGASDHSLLSFSFRCYTKQKPKSHTTLMYHKADYDSMRQDLRQDWDMLFKNMSTNQIWSILQNKINAAINKHVPRTKSVLTSAAKRKPVWMSYKALTKVRKKHKAWQRYMNTQEGSDYHEYAKARNQARNETRKALRDYEKDITKNIKTNPIFFWRYGTSKLKTTGEVPHLKRNDGSMTETDEDKVNELNTYFISVFTHEQGPPPTIGQRAFISALSDIQISLEDITLRLKKMNPNKAPGPDNQHPCVFRELYDILDVPLLLIFRKSLEEGCLPESWKQANTQKRIEKLVQQL